MFPRLIPVRLSGKEPLHIAGTPQGPTVLDFWQWAGSDLVSNTFRGGFAEFIVACDLGIAWNTRRDWEAVDLVTPGGKKVEVKSSAYLQSWKQNRLSVPRFSIRPSRDWDPETNTLGKGAARRADVYVFCLHAHKDKDTLDIRDLSQWVFFVMTTERVEKTFGARSSVSIKDLQGAGAAEVKFGEIGKVFAQIVDNFLGR